MTCDPTDTEPVAVAAAADGGPIRVLSPMSRDEMLAMEGSGWDGDLEALSVDDAV